MSLLDEVRQAQRAKRNGLACRVAVLLEQLDEKNRGDLQAAMDDVTIQHQTLADVCNAKKFHGEGKPFKAEPFSRHRRGKCGCFS